MTRAFNPRTIPCEVSTCTSTFANLGGLRNHMRIHRRPSQNTTMEGGASTPENLNHTGTTSIPPLGDPVDAEIDNSTTTTIDKETIHRHPLINGMIPLDSTKTKLIKSIQAFRVMKTAHFCPLLLCHHLQQTYPLTISRHLRIVHNFVLLTFSIGNRRSRERPSMS